MIEILTLIITELCKKIMINFLLKSQKNREIKAKQSNGVYYNI